MSSPSSISTLSPQLKLLLAAAIVFGLCAVGIGQTDSTPRPRVAPTGTPPILAGSDPVAKSDAAPVLKGATPANSPAPAATTPIDDDVIKVETNLVTTPVSILDRDGRFIPGLSIADFKIFEDGKEQKVEYFQSVEQPFTVVLLIDVSPSTAFKIEEIQNAAIAFVDQLRPADRVMVIAFDRHVNVLTPPTNNRNELQTAIRQAKFGEGTSLYEAVDYAIRMELSRVTGRKAVVLFTDGVDTTSKRAGYDSTLRSVEEIDALFYTIRYDTSSDARNRSGSNGSNSSNGPGALAGLIGSILGGKINAKIVNAGNSSASPGQYAKGKQYLESLAQNSGGREFEADTIGNVDAAFSGIAEKLRRQYSLGYYPETGGNLGDRKQIKVQVTRPEAVVRSRTSYVIGQNGRKSN